MTRMGFGAFLAPHHPIGEHPTLQLRRDLDLAEHLDRLGYDEFWCGEHHSTGWEVIASPEMFLAAAGERTHRIKLGTGVVSLPFHHPFHVAQRIVQLDHMTRGRVIFGTGPGALPSDAFTLGIDPMVTARPPGRSDRRDPPLAPRRRALRLRVRVVQAPRSEASTSPAAGRHADGGGVDDQPLGHDARRQVRYRRALDRLDVDRRTRCAADAVELRRGGGRATTARR